MYFSSKRRTALVMFFVKLVLLTWLIPAPTIDAIEWGAVIEESYDFFTIPYQHSYTMSADGTTIAVGSQRFEPPYSFYIRVYEKKLLRRKYEQIGLDIILSSEELDILSLILSADGSTMAAGLSSRNRDPETLLTENRSGQVWIYQRDSSNQIYKEVGPDIKGEGVRCCRQYPYCGNYSDCLIDRHDFFETSLAMSADGTTIAVRAPFSIDADIVRVYQKDSSNQMYEQIGSDINVNNTGVYFFGGSLVMSADGTIITVTFNGLFRVYLKDPSNQMFQQIGSDIKVVEGSFTDDFAMSADGTTIAIDTGDSRGILVYQKESLDETYKQIGENILYPTTKIGFREIAISADGKRIVVSYILDNFEVDYFPDGILVLLVPNFRPNPAQVRVFQQDSDTKTYDEVEFLEIPGNFADFGPGSAWSSITGDGKMIVVGVVNAATDIDRFQVYTTKQCVFGFKNFFCPFSFRAVWVGLLRVLFKKTT